MKQLYFCDTGIFDNFREYLKNHHIGDLLIPGTHDSGCYGGVRIFEDYILTQDLPIWHQLIFGIRYLDLRIAYHQDEMLVNHLYAIIFVADEDIAECAYIIRVNLRTQI